VGRGARFSHDVLKRRIKATYADGARANFTYDAAGRLLQADDTADPHRPITLSYDSLDRLLSETTSLGTVSYQYDPLGRRNQMIVGGQTPVAYSYDATSRLRTITQAPLNPVDIQYDALGRRTLLTLPNQVSTEYQYDPASRLTALIYRNALGPLGDLTYQYDPAGNRVGVGGSFARTLLPDPVPSATYDAGNRQVAFGQKIMQFDGQGNLTTLTEAVGTTAYAWDARNRLAALTAPGLAASFSYDAFSRRAWKNVGGILTRFQYDGLNLSREIVAGVQASYLPSLNIDEILTRSDPTATLYYFTDPLGNTVGLTDPTGNPVTAYTYEPYGRAVALGGNIPNPFQFTGRENDGTALFYYRARYYAPARHVFLSEDPLGLASGDTNLYRYVMGNPVLLRDPMGLQKSWRLGSPPPPFRNPYEDFDERQRADFDRFVERVQEAIRKTGEQAKEGAAELLKWASQMVELLEKRVPGAPLPMVLEDVLKGLMKDIGSWPRDADAAELSMKSEGPPPKGAFGRGR
jgi:RHS repeat-associated protein